VEEDARQRFEPPLMEVHEANDVAGREGGFGSSSLLGMIHSSCAVFITGRRSPSSMSCDAILLVKLEHPHGSIEKARKHFGNNGSGSGCCGVSSLSVYLFLSLAC
jgi:hypothetical protein